MKKKVSKKAVKPAIKQVAKQPMQVSNNQPMQKPVFKCGGAKKKMKK